MNSLKKFLIENGASDVGFADLSGIATDHLRSGVAIILRLPEEIIRSIADGPNMDYYNLYFEMNDKLNVLAKLGAQFIRDNGYEAIAQTTGYVKEIGNYRTQLPHKTVATLAGIGWIGKSALLVTKKYGSAVRLTSILTDMPLDYGVPVTKSMCPRECYICMNACPGKAISGKLWDQTMDRNEFYDPLKCREKALQLSKERMNKEITLCGKCIEVCPYTRKYINRQG